MKIELSQNNQRNADELDRLARTFWQAGFVMAATLIAAAALSVRDNEPLGDDPAPVRLPRSDTKLTLH